MSVKQNFPTIKPTLNLDFANSKAVDPRITFTRASAATYTDVQGILQTVRDNKPRIDFDTSTGECKGLLIEEQRTNLYTRSGHPHMWNDTFNGSFLPNAAIAPDGTMTALLITATTNDPFIYQTVGVSGNVVVSVWVKASGAAVGKTGTIRISGVSVTTPAFTNSWQRITANFNVTGTYIVGFEFPDSGAATGDQVYIWGPQIESGTFATSYIPSQTTFTSRASSATYFDSTGVMRTAPVNGARYGYGYDSTTGKWISQGLVLESAASNTQPHSSGVTSYELATGLVLDQIAPDLSLCYRAETFMFNTFNDSVNQSLVQSFYVKKVNWRYIRLGWSGVGPNNSSLGGVTGTDADAIFDFDTGAFTAFGSNVNNKWRVEAAGNGWYRLWITYTNGSTYTSGNSYIRLATSGTNFTPITGYSFAAWGAQHEVGNVPSSYIPTTTSSVTRAADVSSSAATTRAVDSAVIKSSDFTKLNSSTAGTLYGEGTIISSTALGNGAPALVALSNSADRDTHRFIVRRTNMTGDATYAGFNYRLATVIDGTSYSIDYSAAEGAQPEWEDSAVHKTIFGIDTTSQQAYGDGVSAGITSISVPNFDKFDQVEIGQGGSSSSWNGHIRKVTYYNKRLSNTQLQALTV